MRKSILALLFIVGVASIAAATPAGVRFSEPLDSQRVDKGIVFNATIDKASLAPGVSYNYVVNPTVDLVVEVETGGEGAAKLIVFEDPTTTGGTTQTAYNENRTSSLVATSLVTLTAAPTTVSATGTAVYTKDSYDGEVIKRFVFDKDNSYLLNLTNLSTTTYNYSVGVRFYDNALRIK